MNIDPSKLKIMTVRGSDLKKAGEGNTLGIRGNSSPGEPKEKVSLGGQSSIFKTISLNPRVLDKAEHTGSADKAKVLRNDEFKLKDGFDASRDLTGVAWDEGKPSDPYRISVEVSHLRDGAQLGKLDVYTLISIGNRGGRVNLPDNLPGVTTQPWNLSVGKYDEKHFNAIDDNGQPRPDAVTSVKFDHLHNKVDFSLNKEVLRDMGWKDGEPLKMQILTAKDFVLKVTDSLDEPHKKPWANDGKLTRYVDTSNPQSINAPRDNDWSDDIIYFVLTDRFHDGDKTNNFDVEKDNLVRFQGGDLQGLIDKMDYIKDLGISALWITPAMKNQTDFVDSSGYHGYWPVDFMKVDRRLGDMEKFREMVDVAHDKGIKVILDMPLNHTAWEHPFWKDPDKHDWFHHIGDIVDWDCPHQIENGSMYGLPDLAQENPEVYDYLLDVCKYWIDEGGVDGFRLDAVKHVPRDFWEKFSLDIRKHAGPDFFMIGEVFDGNPDLIGKYQSDGMPSLFDMPLYFTAKHVFAKDGSMMDVAGQLDSLNQKYENPNIMGGFIDNHDTDRFITYAGGGEGGREKLRLALGFLFSINRIPTLYYGTEQSMDGRLEKFGQNPPENRASMEFDKDPKMEQYVKDLISIRNSSQALKSGTLLEMWKDHHVYSFSRITPEEEVVVVLNNGYDPQPRNIPIRQESNLKNGDVLKDALTGAEVAVKDGRIQVEPGRKQAMILIPKKKEA